MSKELHEAIARLRRSQPRNADTMLVCDGLEDSLRTASMPSPIIVKPLPVAKAGACPECVARRKASADRVAKHREKNKP